MTSLSLPTSLTTEIEDEELLLMSVTVEDKVICTTQNTGSHFILSGFKYYVLTLKLII